MNNTCEKKIWAITTIKILSEDDKKHYHYESYHIRTVGIFETKERAIRIIEGNYGALEEAGYYQYAVIEELEYGLYPHCNHKETLIYKFDRDMPPYEEIDDGQWVRVDKLPDEIDYEHLVSVSEIG